MEGQARTSQKEAEKLRKQQTRYTILITHLVLSLGAFFSSFLVLPLSVPKEKTGFALGVGVQAMRCVKRTG